MHFEVIDTEILIQQLSVLAGPLGACDVRLRESTQQGVLELSCLPLAILGWWQREDDRGEQTGAVTPTDVPSARVRRYEA